MPLKFEIEINDIELEFIKLVVVPGSDGHVRLVVPFYYKQSDGRTYKKSEMSFWAHRVNSTREQERTNHALDDDDVEYLKDLINRIRSRIMDMEGIS